ncbi:MAG: sulfatase [Opitutaceae bacterium]|nr:sulfatase [Opitutaceae bacterium]
MALTALIVGLFSTLTVHAAQAARPNVLLVCVDDLKPLLGCYGDKTVKSPNIDRLAARGMVLESAYCNQAVCSPSRNALMIGMRSTSLGIYDLPTHFRVAAPDAVTVAQYFKQQGWKTEGLGKILHTGHGNHEDPASWSVPHWRPSTGNYVTPAGRDARGPAAKNATKASEAKGAAVENADVPDDAYADGKIATEAIRRLRAARENPRQPFFLAVGFLKPHLPFCAPKKYWDMYNRAALKISESTTAPKGAPAYAPTTSGELRTYADIPPTGPIPADQQRELIHGYNAAVSYMDAQLGRVLDELDRLSFADNTIVVVWGDHGWHLGDHGQWCKHTNYEEAAHIPIVVRAPGVTKPGSRTKALVETVDLYSTLVELAGLPPASPPQKLDGRSFVATLRHPTAPTKPAVFHSYPRSRPGDGPVIGRAVRTERFRLVEWKKPGAPANTADIELYDYVADRAETENLAAAKPEIVQQLRAVLAAQPEAVPQVRAAATTNEKAVGAKKKKKKSG